MLAPYAKYKFSSMICILFGYHQIIGATGAG
jgi:hypothetical protein